MLKIALIIYLMHCLRLESLHYRHFALVLLLCIIFYESHSLHQNVINEIILNKNGHFWWKFKSEAHVGTRGLVSGRDYLRFANIQEKKLKYIQENTGIYRNQTRVNHVSQCDIQIQYRIYYTSDTQDTFALKD